MARLVVLGDSLTFHDDTGPVPLAEPRLWPNLPASALQERTAQPWDAVVVARAGWSVRDTWLALQKDVHLQQQVLMGADAVVMAVGSTDQLPVGVPRVVNAALPYVRPTRLRRRLRRGLDAAHPHLVAATRGALVWTPPPVYAHCWRKTIGGLRLFAPGAPLCAVLPGIHVGRYYGGGHNPQHERYAALTARLAAEEGVPVVDLAALTRPWLDRLNPDGLHWPYGLHADVAAAMAAALDASLQARLSAAETT